MISSHLISTKSFPPFSKEKKGRKDREGSEARPSCVSTVVGPSFPRRSGPPRISYNGTLHVSCCMSLHRALYIQITETLCVKKVEKNASTLSVIS
jgi:hypothetical protein